MTLLSSAAAARATWPRSDSHSARSARQCDRDRADVALRCCGAPSQPQALGHTGGSKHTRSCRSAPTSNGCLNDGWHVHWWKRPSQFIRRGLRAPLEPSATRRTGDVAEHRGGRTVARCVHASASAHTCLRSRMQAARCLAWMLASSLIHDCSGCLSSNPASTTSAPGWGDAALSQELCSGWGAPLTRHQPVRARPRRRFDERERHAVLGSLDVRRSDAHPPPHQGRPVAALVPRSHTQPARRPLLVRDLAVG
jgi:hypothetical protein